MDKRQIDTVLDNVDKQRTYRKTLGRYRKSMREGFYFI